MWIKAQFPSGANFRFSIGRSGERLAMAFSNDQKILREQMKIFMKWLNFREGETNQQRFDRIEDLCMKYTSGNQLIQSISSINAK